MTREAPPLSFVELIAPLDDAAFFAEHLGRHALRLPARPLSGLDGVDASALATLGPGHVDVIVGGLATPEPAIAIPEGCSLRVRRVQVLDATVERFARGLAAALRQEARKKPSLTTRVGEVRVGMKINRTRAERLAEPRVEPLSHTLGRLCAGIAASDTSHQLSGRLLRVDSAKDAEDLCATFPVDDRPYPVHFNPPFL